MLPQPDQLVVARCRTYRQAVHRTRSARDSTIPNRCLTNHTSMLHFSVSNTVTCYLGFVVRPCRERTLPTGCGHGAGR
jgi:hypothetical protein